MDFLAKAPDSMQDAKIKGMKMKIGVAVSQDGISWGRVEGDDPSGACMVPYDPKDPNQESSKMEQELYCGWPEVVVTPEASEKAFTMYYSTMLRDSKEKCIAYAKSEDGFRWFKQGVCLRPDEEELDAGGCARCAVVKDAEFDGKSWHEKDSWTMYYEGVSKDGKHRIMKAESVNGSTWTKLGLAFDVGPPGSWDGEGVGSPHIIRYVFATLLLKSTQQVI